MDKWGKITCYDDTSGDILDPKLVQEARMLEVEYLTRMKVYDVLSRKAMKQSGKGEIPSERCAWRRGGDFRHLRALLRWARYPGREALQVNLR